MKQIIFFFLGLSLFFPTYSQPGDYNGPAKTTVKNFWSQAEATRSYIEQGSMFVAQNKITSMERAIATTKDKDPSYNISSMEAEFKKIKEMYDAKTKEKGDEANAQKEKFRNQLAVEEKLGSLFGVELVLQVDNAGLKTINEKIGNYKKRTEELLAMDRSGSEKDLNRYATYIRNSFENTEANFKKLEERAKTSADPAYAEVNYYELLYNQAYWDAAQKIYPDQPDFAKAYSKVTGIINGIGSIESLHASTEKNRVEKIKNTKLPEAKAKDAAIEKLFMDAFNKQYKDEFKGTAVKAVITTSDWSIRRHEISGIVVGRQREGAIAYKGTDGKCFLITHFNIFQDYVGGTYQGTKSIYVVYKGQEMLCENVK